jgi:hypothetical protein
VTMLFALKNTGQTSTSNLVATLQSNSGVLAPSGPQAYGVVPAGGSAVVEAFTFSANGGCGSNLTLNLQLQDGAWNLGTASVSYVLGPMVTVLTQNFDSVTAPTLPSGWTTTNGGAQSRWFTTNSGADGLPNAAFSGDGNNVGSNELNSVTFALPNGPAQLTFRNNYNLEYDTAKPTNGYDGGVLEIKIGSGAFLDITNAGGVFVSGAYNARISTLYKNPFGGRWGWSGNSSGYVTTVVNLPAAAQGQTIQLRWRCGTDDGNAGPGWRIDSIGVTARACCSRTAPTLPAQTNRTVTGLVTVVVTNTATDATVPANSLLYTLTQAPTNAFIDANGVITWTPLPTQEPSTNSFTTVVTDNGIPALSDTNTFIVTALDQNLPPVLPVIPPQTVTELTLLTVINTATNPNIHATIAGYTLVNMPAGAVINTNGVITWTPSQAQSPSTNTITTVVTNTDPYDLVSPHLTATNSFTVFVVPPPIPAPVIESISLASNVVVITWSATAGRTYRLQYINAQTLTNWIDVPPDLTASGPSLFATNMLDSTQRYYRVLRLP